MLPLRWGLILLSALILSLLLGVHWNQTMKADLRYFREAKACLDAGNTPGALNVLAQWNEVNPECVQDSRYSALLADAAGKVGNAEALDLGRRMTVINVLAGK